MRLKIGARQGGGLALTFGILAFASVLQAEATQADSTLITFSSDAESAVPFIHKLHFTVNPVANLKSVQFTIAPRTGSVTRALSATYPSAYLTGRGFLDGSGNPFPYLAFTITPLTLSLSATLFLITRSGRSLVRLRPRPTPIRAATRILT